MWRWWRQISHKKGQRSRRACDIGQSDNVIEWSNSWKYLMKTGDDWLFSSSTFFAHFTSIPILNILSERKACPDTNSSEILINECTLCNARAGNDFIDIFFLSSLTYREHIRYMHAYGRTYKTKLYRFLLAKTPYTSSHVEQRGFSTSA